MKISKKDVEAYFDPERRKCALWGRAFEVHKNQDEAKAWLLGVLEELAEIHQERRGDESKFKLGDRVLAAEDFNQPPGTVINYSGSQYKIHWDEQKFPDPMPYDEWELIRA